MNFATLKGLTIPEGKVTKITDASGRVLWRKFWDDSYIFWDESSVELSPNSSYWYSYTVANSGSLVDDPYNYDAIELDGKHYPISWTLVEEGTQDGDIYSGTVIGLDGIRFEWESRHYADIFIRCTFTWELLIFGNFEQ